MATQNSDIIVAGHFSIDSISLPNRLHPIVVLGGSAAYTSLTAKRLGATVSVISKVGADFPEAYMWWLNQEGIDLTNVIKATNEKTTSFELKYSEDLTKRTLRLKNKTSPITKNEIPNTLHAKAIHIAPIANELPYETIEHLKARAEILSLDPQGILRSFDMAGNVKHHSTIDKRILNQITIYKSSAEELKAATHCQNLNTAIKTIHNLGIETVIITLGAKGAILSIGRTRYNIPAYKSAIALDPTGAGDAFIGAFLTEYIRQKDALWCTCVGSAAASLIVEAIGPTFLGEKGEIYQRAQTIYEKGIKQ
ncbi:MAG: carbohydrate kinase family protein [Candidatus Bathyarchaeia archaeon]